MSRISPNMEEVRRMVILTSLGVRNVTRKWGVCHNSHVICIRKAEELQSR